MAVSPDPSRAPFLRQLDGVAALLSSLCLLHCLLLPVLLVMAPALFGTLLPGLHGPEWLHWAFILVALPFSLHALLKGHALHHQPLPMLLAALGFVAMAAGAMAHGQPLAERWLTVGGGLAVAIAHWINWRLRAKAR